MYFESGTVKSDCPVQIFKENDELFRNWFTLLVLLFFTGDIKKTLKKALKKL